MTSGPTDPIVRRATGADVASLGSLGALLVQEHHEFDRQRLRLGPEERSATTPGALEDVGQDEHGHVAPHAVALHGDLQKLAAHGVLRCRIAVIELQRVGLAAAVRIASVREHPVDAAYTKTRVVLRRLRQVGLGAGEEVLRVCFDPRMIRRHVVGDKIEHQSQAAILEALPDPRQRRVAPQGGMHGVAG